MDPLTVDAKCRKIFFTADLHLGHANVIPYDDRPFASVEEMEVGICERWNATVAPDDLVFILGDFVWGPGGREKVRAEISRILASLNGRKILVCGNHDKPTLKHASDLFDACFSGNLDERLPSNPVAIVVGAHKRGNVIVGMSHEPAGSPIPDVLSIAHRLKAPAALCLHGHMHKQTILSYVAEFIEKENVKWFRQNHLRPHHIVPCPRLNVGMCVRDYRPVEIRELLAGAARVFKAGGTKA